jgi:hypothetical protein
MCANDVDNHQEASFNLVDAFFAHKAALIDVCGFVVCILKPLIFSIY